MCYVVAKKPDATGCVALRITHREKLVELKKRIYAQFDPMEIKLITISRPSAYVEYEPCRFVATEADFEEAVAQLWHIVE